jgi:hypothetical protein
MAAAEGHTATIELQKWRYCKDNWEILRGATHSQGSRCNGQPHPLTLSYHPIFSLAFKCIPATFCAFKLSIFNV